MINFSIKTLIIKNEIAISNSSYFVFLLQLIWNLKQNLVY